MNLTPHPDNIQIRTSIIKAVYRILVNEVLNYCNYSATVGDYPSIALAGEVAFFSTACAVTV
jgi:hypothetical protein